MKRPQSSEVKEKSDSESKSAESKDGKVTNDTSRSTGGFCYVYHCLLTFNPYLLDAKAFNLSLS